MAEETRMRQASNNYKMNMGSWPTERWTAVVVLLCLALLILIRRGFRGVSFAGASVSVG
jgi:hypothetical protein